MCVHVLCRCLHECIWMHICVNPHVYLLECVLVCFGVWACESTFVCEWRQHMDSALLPVGRGTAWLSVNHSLTPDLPGSHKESKTHTHKARYLHTRTQMYVHSQPASCLHRLSVPHRALERTEEVRVTVSRAGRIVFSGCERVTLESTLIFKPTCHPAGKPARRGRAFFHTLNKRRLLWCCQLGGKNSDVNYDICQQSFALNVANRHQRLYVTIHERLCECLLIKNKRLTFLKFKCMVQLLWDFFEMVLQVDHSHPVPNRSH